MKPHTLFVPMFTVLAGCPAQHATQSPDQAAPSAAAPSAVAPSAAAPAAIAPSATASADPAPVADGTVTVEAMLVVGPVMQHPVISAPPGVPSRVTNYLELDGAQTVVYAPTRITCSKDADPSAAAPSEAVSVAPSSAKPARVRLVGRWTSVTGSKFGQVGTEKQFEAQSWECLP